jgi:hypothetical protein
MDFVSGLGTYRIVGQELARYLGMLGMVAAKKNG